MSFLNYEYESVNNMDDNFNYQNDTTALPVISETSKLNYVNEIREILLNLVQKKPEIIEMDNEEYKNKDIDDIITKIDEILPNMVTIQDELTNLENSYKDEEQKVREIIKKLDKMISFLIDILNNNDWPKMGGDNDTYPQHIHTMIESVNKLSDGYLKSQKLSEVGEKYIGKRKEMNSYLYFINKLNRWNVCNICSICLTNRVDHYCNPCGHTACKKCIDKNMVYQYNNTNNNNEKKCPFCRSIIINTKPLYFL